MKKGKGSTKFVIIAVVTLFLLTFAGISSSAEPGFPLSGWPKAIAIGTPSAGSSHHIVLVGVGVMIKKYLGVSSNAHALGGSEPNVRAIGAGRVEMASIDAISLSEAAQGVGRFKKKIPVRLVCNAFPFAMHVWTRADTGIKKFKDLKGKRFMGKSPTSRITNDAAFYTMECYGLSYDDFVIMPITKMPEGTRSLRDRTADAFWWPGNPTIPASHYAEMTMTVDCRLIPLGEKEMKCVNKKLPYVVPGVIKGGMYKGVDKDVPSLAFYNSFVASRDLADSFIYEILKLMYGSKHSAEFQKVHGVAKGIVPEIALKSVVAPVHAGAVKWYKENGFWTPELEARQKELLAKIGEVK